jgi:membrane protein
MASLRTYGVKVRDALAYYVGGVYRQVFEKDIFLWAQAISFKVLITLVPCVILATGVLGLLMGSDVFDGVAQFIRQYLPREQARPLLGFMEGLQASGTFYTTVGIIALVFSAMTLFTTLRVVISNVFQEPWHKQRTILGGYAFDLRMSAQVGLVFVLTFGLTLLSQRVNEDGLLWVGRMGLDYVWVQQGWRTTFRLFGLLVPWLLSVAMFFQLFFFIPKPHPPKRSALLGAGVTGLLWEVAKYGFAFFAANVGRFDQYDVPGLPGEALPEGTIPGLGKAFGLIIAFVFWAYYSGLVLCVGALIAVLHEKRHRLRRLLEQKPELAVAPPEMSEAEAYLAVPLDAAVDAAGESAIPVPRAEAARDAY